MNWNINADIMKVLDMLGIPMTGGNGGVLRSIAQEWKSMADAVEVQIGTLDRAVAAVVPDQWTGDAANAFHAHWQSQASEVATGVANFRTVADGLNKYADTVDSINEEILSICEQILAASAVGAVLTVVTAGISDAVAAAADAVEVARIVALVAKFTELAEQVGVDLERVAEIVESLLAKLKDLIEFLKDSKYGKMAINTAKTLTSNFVADAGANVSSQYLAGQQVTWGDDMKNGALDAVGTVMTAGALGKVPINRKTLAGLANVGGGIFQSEVGGLRGYSGDSAFENPFSAAGLSSDAQTLEGAAADGIGGAYAHDGDTAKNGQVFSVTDTLGSLTTGTETSGTNLKKTLSSLDGKGGAIPVDQA
jgi:WXG100 family type VII secretion target